MKIGPNRKQFGSFLIYVVYVTYQSLEVFMSLNPGTTVILIVYS